MPGLPQITVEMLLLGFAVLAGGLLLAWVLRFAVAAVLTWGGNSPSAAKVFSWLTQVVVSILSVAAALTIVFPSVRPVDVLGGVGILTLAAGIAFQTVLGNIFAGMVILARDRFRVGDQISVGEFSGNVTRISLASTSLRTFDGHQVVLPNSTLHSSPVTVQTGYEKVRSTVTVDLEQDVDLDLASRIALEAMYDLPAVLADPDPQVLFSGIADGNVTLDLRFWSGSRRMETNEARHAVIRSVMAALQENGIRLASPDITLGSSREA